MRSHSHECCAHALTHRDTGSWVYWKLLPNRNKCRNLNMNKIFSDSSKATGQGQGSKNYTDMAKTTEICVQFKSQPHPGKFQSSFRSPNSCTTTSLWASSMLKVTLLQCSRIFMPTQPLNDQTIISFILRIQDLMHKLTKHKNLS